MFYNNSIETLHHMARFIVDSVDQLETQFKQTEPALAKLEQLKRAKNVQIKHDVGTK